MGTADCAVSGRASKRSTPRSPRARGGPGAHLFPQMLGALVMTSLLSVSVAQAPSAGGVERDSGIDAAALPIVSYNSDIGLGFGAVAGAYIYGPGYRPFRHAIGVQAFVTTE